MGRRGYRRQTIPTLLALLSLSGCGNDSGDVVLYVSADDYVARQVVARFEEKSGLDIRIVGDTEATKTTGLANRIRAEKDNPRADVFWSSECFMTIQLAEEGLLEPHVSEVTRDWPAQYRDGEHRWHGFALRARVLVYNTDKISPDILPDQWTDLKAERWKGRIVMADPRFGTTRGHLGAMKHYWESEIPGAFSLFLDDLAENETRLLTSGNAGVVRAVGTGEAHIGMTDTDDVWAAQRNGMPVDLVYPYHGIPGEPGDGTLLIPNTVAIVKGARNREAAARLADFLLSEEVERMLAESDSHNIPVREEVAREFPQYAVPDPLKIDLEQAAAKMDEAVEQAMMSLRSAGD